MIIECPACSKKFNINEKLIPDEGRLLKCGNCDHTWFYKKEENLTFGAGLIIPVGNMKIRADYGYANFEHLSDPKRFSIGFSF